ncbi:hypothetical protein WJX84_011032 [Apatococcus fuscideae]|uniref:asparagine--tRNA ligase n=1 Tax=Apatococcus fuscideae TaxID=2026836 RepID=A0AAW1SXP0_9CHLO
MEVHPGPVSAPNTTPDPIQQGMAGLAVEGSTMAQKEEVVAKYSSSYGRSMMGRLLDSPDGGLQMVGQTLTFGGWVKTGREQGAGAFAFLEVNDGSTFTNLQVMVTKEIAEAHGGLKSLVSTGTSILVKGTVEKPPEGAKQTVELKAIEILHLGQVVAGSKSYPLAKKKQSMEYLREKMHLRARTNTIGAVARIRNALAFATHDFFQKHGFLYVHTPLITASDCEGAGEMFQVTTLLSKADEMAAEAAPPADVDSLRESASQQGAAVKQAKDAAAADKGNTELQQAVTQQVEALKQAKANLQKAEKQQQERTSMVGGLPRLPDGSIDYSKDFFSKKAFMTVSGQLNGEYYACALSSIYTFGPTFRAEDSHTSRHLAEFWMIEPEIAYCQLDDCMRCAEDYVQHCCRYLLERSRGDLKFIVEQIDKTAIQRLEHVANTAFKRLSYTEAVEILEEAIKIKKKKFEFKVSWGVDLSSEHERYLTEEVFQQPVIVYNYPKAIKAFYMRANDDGRTVAAMDVLVPKVGELIGGSQREERLEVLEERLQASGMPLEPYEGYLDLRRYGTVPHAGFGLGFERLILFATGLDNIREVIPFPRWPGHADY